MSKKFDFEIVSKTPFVYLSTNELGVERVQIYDCDFDKRCKIIRANGELDEVKWGYLFKTPEEVERFNSYNWETDDYKDLPSCINVYKELLSRKNYAKWKKYDVKEDRANTLYYVADKNENIYSAKFKAKTLKKALRHFAFTLYHITEDEVGLFSERDGCLLYSESKDSLTTYESRPRKRCGNTVGIKSRHTYRNSGYRELRKPSLRGRKRSW